MKIFEDIKKIKGIGDKTAALFNRLSVFTVEDLLHYYPRTYVKYEEPVKIKDALDGETCSMRLFVNADFKWKKVRNLSIGTGYASDGENTVAVTFFNVPYLKSKMVKGARYIFRSKLIIENGRYKLEQPSVYTEAEYEDLMQSLMPVYPLTKGLSNKTVQKSVERCIEDENYPSMYEEYLTEDIVDSFSLMSTKEAIKMMHFPKDPLDLLNARKRLAFDELITFLMMVRRYEKGSKKREQSSFAMIESALPERLIEKLPFELTDGQKDAYNDVKEDLCSGFIMNRLIQGDVGSGKTIVAFLAMLTCAGNGYQSAIMVPTEILAIMHFNNLKKMIDDYDLPVNIHLLTGHTSAKDRKEILSSIKENKGDLIVGTHALFQEDVEFNDLALVITDEQHRFGVRQRQYFSQKGNKPHILAMSATPIPRTLSIVLFRDMSLSVIEHKPSNRLPVKNCVVGTSYRNKAYEFIVSEIRKGHQAYIICPMVEMNEGIENIENVTDYASMLKSVMPKDISIDILHGRMKDDVKNKVMENFVNRNTDILVATTVVEVGVDVPNATVMMIENAERFGLSQLHQLRGRIGRGDAQSYCIFLNCQKNGKDNERLNILNSSNDGFKIAEEDLRLRGSGDIFGIRQSGRIKFDIADIYEDHKLIESINDLIDDISEKDPSGTLSCYIPLYEHVRDNEHKFIDFNTI
ncbi:MAG: ATP-dependent DNA helicase RecG [Lachnospiraceae bacterium]|nr:ATP-dependent DNA helicase RecG [Lachnospiraceae bacterium]